MNINLTWENFQHFDWVKDMVGVQQSPLYHAEGDVHIHTRMVVESLESLPEYQSLASDEKQLVWMAALMHDIEKRSTTFTDENGDIVSPGHSKKGAMSARGILYRDLAMPFSQREEIVGLVRHHGLPLWIFSKPNPEKALIKASFEVNTRLVALLAKADVLGRICPDKEELFERIELFRELCIEHQCWGKPKDFETSLAKFNYFIKENQSLDYCPFDDFENEVVLMSGIAGSGKDHYIRTKLSHLPVISLDDMRRKEKVSHNDPKGNGQIIQKAKEMAREYLRNKKPFIWNATNITSQMRSTLIELFATYKAKTRIVYVETEYKKLIHQNIDRNHPIPRAALEKMIDKLEVPKAWECCELVAV